MAPDEKKETEDPFLRSKLQYLYNIDLLEKKYRALEAQELDSRIEIDFISGQVYFPKDASKRAVQRAYSNLKRLNKEFGSSFLKDLKRGTGSSFDIFHHKDIILPPMVPGDCARSRECSPSPRSSPRNLETLSRSLSNGPFWFREFCWGISRVIW
ncbi:hypothetical protein V3C99_003153 [Haemonchus contortus]